MKKLITILLLVAIIPTLVFANFLNLSAGTNYSSSDNNNSDELNFGSIKMGPEVRANLSFIEAGLKSQYLTQYMGNNSKLVLSGDVNVLIDLSLIQLGVGISSDPYALLFKEDGSTSTDSDESLEDWLMDSNLNWRLSGGVTLGHLRLIADYTVPTDFKFSDEDTSTIIPDSWENGKVSISFLYNLFR